MVEEDEVVVVEDEVVEEEDEVVVEEDELVVEDRSAGKNFLCHLTQDCFIIQQALHSS